MKTSGIAIVRPITKLKDLQFGTSVEGLISVMDSRGVPLGTVTLDELKSYVDGVTSGTTFLNQIRYPVKRGRKRKTYKLVLKASHG